MRWPMENRCPGARSFRAWEECKLCPRFPELAEEEQRSQVENMAELYC
jgi:hypothetical protein